MAPIFHSIDDNILNEKFTSIYRPGYINIKGFTLPKRFKECYDTINNWTVHEDDIWICSFPKTGTTWSQEMIWMIANDLNFKEAAENCLSARFPFLDHSFLFDYRNVYKMYDDFEPPNYFEDSINYVKNQKRPRHIKTHLPWVLLPNEIQNGTKKPKIIYVTRNPKDTCVSYYHHCKLIESYKGTFEEFCKLFFEGKVSFAPYWDNVLQFWERRHESNILFIKYEDLKTDLAGTIRKVAAFLGKVLTEEQVQQLVNHLSFESMKNNKSVNYEGFLEMHKKHKLIEDEGCFIRSGSVGGYKEEMSEELINKFDLWIKLNAPKDGLGY